MGQSKRRQFTPEFKAQAVKRVVDGGHSIRQIAADLGVCESLLRRWRREREDRFAGADGGGRRGCGLVAGRGGAPSAP